MAQNPDPRDTAAICSLHELCMVCVVDEHVVVEMVEIGIVSPRGADPASWRFDTSAVLRMKRAQRLRRDLELDLAGVAVALDLLDELEAAKLRVRTLETHLAQLIEDD